MPKVSLIRPPRKNPGVIDSIMPLLMPMPPPGIFPAFTASKKPVPNLLTLAAFTTYSPDETRAKTSSALGPPEPGTIPPSAKLRVGKTSPRKFKPVVITAFAARSAKPFLMASVNVPKSSSPVWKKSESVVSKDPKDPVTKSAMFEALSEIAS